MQPGGESSRGVDTGRLRSLLWALDVVSLLLFVALVGYVAWLLVPSQQQQQQQQQGSWSGVVNWLCLVGPLLLPWVQSKGRWALGLVGVAERDQAIAWSQLLSTAAAVVSTVLHSSAMDEVVQQLVWLTQGFGGVLLWSGFAKPWAPPLDAWPAVICSLCRLVDTTSHVYALKRCVGPEAWQRLQASAVAPLGVLVPLVSLTSILPSVAAQVLKPKVTGSA